MQAKEQDNAQRKARFARIASTSKRSRLISCSIASRVHKTCYNSGQLRAAFSAYSLSGTHLRECEK